MISSLSRILRQNAADKRLMNELRIAADRVFPTRNMLAGPLESLEYPDWARPSPCLEGVPGEFRHELYRKRRLGLM
jgi:hypothetical protein